MVTVACHLHAAVIGEAARSQRGGMPWHSVIAPVGGGKRAGFVGAFEVGRSPYFLKINRLL